MNRTSLGSSSDIADGEVKQFVADGKKIAVAKIGGVLYAFDDICTHKACPLSKGSLDGITVTCPCHGSQFDVTTGVVLRGPAQEPVSTYPVEVDGNELVVEA